MFYKVHVYIISNISNTMWYKHKIHNHTVHNHICAASTHKHKAQFSTSRYIIFLKNDVFIRNVMNLQQWKRVSTDRWKFWLRTMEPQRIEPFALTQKTGSDRRDPGATRLDALTSRDCDSGSSKQGQHGENAAYCWSPRQALELNHSKNKFSGTFLPDRALLSLSLLTSNLIPRGLTQNFWFQP